MELQNITKIIEQILVKYIEKKDTCFIKRFKQEHCYYTLWLISHINIRKNIPEPNIKMTKLDAIEIEWKINNNNYMRISVPDEGNSHCSIVNFEERCYKTFKRHDIIQIGNIINYAEIMYEGELNEQL